jgi:hypothetical protein
MDGVHLTLARLRGVYDKCPKHFSLPEFLVFFGVFVIYLWIVPFWYWGIYRLDIPFPEILTNLFFRVWQQKDFVRAILVAFFACFFALSFFVRRDSLKELGIRFDNIWESGRECLVALCFLLFIAAAIVLAYPHTFSFDKYIDRGFIDFLIELSSCALWGIIQQFLLQSIVFVRALQIFKRQSIAVVTAAILFSLAHAPNLRLMILTLVFGFLCCLLFVRNRNIVTLGIMHGVVHKVLGMLFSGLLISGLGYYDFNMRVGPPRGFPELFAHLEYKGSDLKVNPSEKMSVPVSIINKSTATWDSEDKEHPVFVSYHLLDAKGEMVAFENTRTPFNKAIEPGGSAIVNLLIDAPSEAGDYYVEVDVVKERIAWFKDKGLKTVLIPLSTR